MSNPNKSTIGNRKNDPDRYLTDAAEILIKEFVNPAELIKFLAESIRYAVLYEYTKPPGESNAGREDYFFSYDMINKIALPWLEGGKDLVQNIAKGFKGIHDYRGAESFYEEVGNIIKAFGLQVSEMSTWGYEEKFIYGIATILKISDNISTYESEVSAEKFNAKASINN